MTKGNKGFSNSFTAGLDAESSESTPSPAVGIIASRSDTLARIATGKMVADRTEWIDPGKCRPWRLHNRDLDHLNEESCRDLIDAFLSATKQRIPAIVRRLKDDPVYDYEIIAGVRRWWTVTWLRSHNHPEFDYLVTIQNVTDEEAFRISDVENRARKDITDWERAKEYAQALELFYDSSQIQMAAHLNLSRSWLTRLLDVARLPQEIVEAFEDKHEITVRIARDIKPFVEDREALARMVAEVRRIRSDRLTIKITAADATKRLVKAALDRPVKRRLSREVLGKDGSVLFSFKRTRGRPLTLTIPADALKNRAEILKALDRVLGEK